MTKVPGCAGGRWSGLGHAVGEITSSESADLGERQDDHREGRRRDFGGVGFCAGPRVGGLSDFERPDPYRLGDVLELFQTEIVDRQVEPPLTLPAGVLGQGRSRRARRFLPVSRRC